MVWGCDWILRLCQHVSECLSVCQAGDSRLTHRDHPTVCHNEYMGVKPCGTRAAYYRHLRAGEKPCDPCRKANTDKAREDKKVLRARKDDIPHGTISGYFNWACRCDKCLKAGARKNARDAASRRERRRQGDLPSFKHGKSGYANWGCRCEICKQAGHDARDYKQEKRHNEKSRDEARNHYEPWTGADLELLTRSDMRLAEKAR